MSKVQQSSLIKLNDVRLSFPSLFKVKVWQSSNSTPKYEASFILDKDLHAKEIEIIKDSINSICSEQKASLENPNLKVCFINGNLTNREEYKNKYVLKSKTGQKFHIVGKDGKTPVYEHENLFYAGCFVSSYISLYYFNKVSVGIGANLKSIQFRKDGPSFDNVQNIDGAFEPSEDEDDLF